jgi:hypothetical protein
VERFALLAEIAIHVDGGEAVVVVAAGDDARVGPDVRADRRRDRRVDAARILGAIDDVSSQVGVGQVGVSTETDGIRLAQHGVDPVGDGGGQAVVIGTLDLRVVGAARGHERGQPQHAQERERQPHT